MTNLVSIEEKYEYNGFPSLRRPDLKPPQGWDLSLLASFQRTRSHSLSPDGQKIAFFWDRDDLSDLYLLSTFPGIEVGSGWPRRLSCGRSPVVFWDDELPRWSPDGRWLAFTMQGHVYVVSPENGCLPRKISDFATEASFRYWMPDSRGLIVGVERHDADQLLLTDLDGAWPRPLTDDSEADSWDARPSPDGKVIAYVRRPFADLHCLEICQIDLRKGERQTLFRSPGIFSHSPRWSPDGTQLAFLSQDSGWFEIWLAGVEGAVGSSQPRQLTHFEQDVGEIAWSPDGEQLVCTVNREGSWELELIEVKSAQSRTLREGRGHISNLHWCVSRLPGTGIGPDSILTFEFESPVQPPEIYRLEPQSSVVQPVTFSTPAALRLDALIMPERIRFPSLDGLQVPALLFRPAHPNGAALVHPHGGPSVQYGDDFDEWAQYVLAKGYTLLAVNYRGSTGYGRPYERLNYDAWGLGDVQDCLAGADYLAQLPGIASDRIGIYGSSYGGYLTICCLARDPQYRFACGISRYGDGDLYTSWAQCNRTLRLYTEMFIDRPSRLRQADIANPYQAGSPIYQVGAIQKPLLLLHGLLDDIVPPQSSEEFAQALRKAGKTFEYKTYAKEGHGFLRYHNKIDAWERMERFLDWYLLPDRDK